MTTLSPSKRPAHTRAALVGDGWMPKPSNHPPQEQVHYLAADRLKLRHLGMTAVHLNVDVRDFCNYDVKTDAVRDARYYAVWRLVRHPGEQIGPVTFYTASRVMGWSKKAVEKAIRWVESDPSRLACGEAMERAMGGSKA